MSDIAPIPLDILGVDFGDRAVTISYIDPREETEYGSRLIQLHLRPEKFEERVAELLEDIFDLITAFQETLTPTPAYRTARGGR